ncbi:MAG: hypothetical protein KatS3mg008_0173 [Acidimicrobiales bacterium]|nr:MAG: hypothetical protein KatS3mg008_0173 [Acidimicrobiales bacterium]
MAFVIAAWSLLRGSDAQLPVWAFALLPAPATVEFVLERLGRARYLSWRQVLLTIPLAVSLGDGFARYLRDPTDLVFWVTVIAYGGVAAFSWIWSLLDSSEH